MGGLSEASLDRHFDAQLIVMREIYAHKISKSDYVISKRWLQLFREATSKEKYARNCLMLLMYSQLRERGSLGKPFIELNNLHRKLDHVLSDYDGILNQAVLGANVSEPEPSSCDINQEFECITQRNKVLLEEINSLHKRTLENETLYKTRDLDLQKKLMEEPKTAAAMLTKVQNQELILKVCRSTSQAIDRLKDWTGVNDQLNFLATSFQHFYMNQPAMRDQIKLLDKRLERILDLLVQQACERREKNVTILYDEMYAQKQEVKHLDLKGREQNQASLCSICYEEQSEATDCPQCLAECSTSVLTPPQSVGRSKKIQFYEKRSSHYDKSQSDSEEFKMVLDLSIDGSK